ncbi:hypothetical protein DV737_g2808, partial [Chaetothyriales sp. CBS 132003]
MAANATTAITTNAEFDKTTEATAVAAAYSGSIKGRTILITGVNKAGIGYGTAEAFASQAPQTLILAGRSKDKLQESKDGLDTKHPGINIRLLVVDLSSQASVRAAGEEVRGWSSEDVSAIHLVVNNAGIMRHGESFDGPVPKTVDGIEDMFATNHLGHFLLINLIMPKILNAAAQSERGSVRIINLSSSGTWVSPFRASDIAWEKPAADLPEKERPKYAMMKYAGMDVDESTAYIPTAAYGASKTCNILFSLGLNQKLFHKYGVLSLAVNPGEVKTELGRNTQSEWLDRMIKKREEMGLLFWKTTGQGASTTLVAATDPKLTLPEDSGDGQFFSDCQAAKAPEWAVDKEYAEKLWRQSEDLVGQSFEP